MTPEGITKLKGHEGLRLKPYKDTVGKTTIGYGRNLDDVGISHDEASMMFGNDVARAEEDCRNRFAWFAGLDPVRQDVIVNLVFNMGIGGVLGFKRMIAAIVAENWTQAAWELSNSAWRQQVGQERHDSLTEALEKGSWGG